MSKVETLLGPRNSKLFFLCLLLVLVQSCTNTNSNRPQHLGVITQDATISSVGGVLVTAVTTGGTAEQAGIRANDVLSRFDNNVLTTTADLRSRIAAKTFATTATIVVSRSTDPLPASVSVPINVNSAGQLPTVLGFSVVQQSDGLHVASVDANSVAANAGVRVDDNILFVNGSQTTTLADAWRVFAPLTTGSTVTIRYTRASLPTTQPGVQPTADISLTADSNAQFSLPVPGLSVQDLTPDLAAHFGFVTATGAQINTLYRDSPAFDAGLQVGDIIIGLTPLDTGEARIDVTSATQLTSLTAAHAGENVAIRYLRGQLPPTSVSLQLSGVPDTATPAPNTGMLLEQLTTSTGAAAGLRVEQVTSSGPASAAGIKRDDRITQVSNTPVISLQDFWNALLAEVDAGNQSIVIQVTPVNGAPRFVALKLGTTTQTSG